MKKRRLSSIIARALVCTALISILLSLAASIGILVKNSYDETVALIKDNLEDVNDDITETIRDGVLSSAVELEQILWNNMYDLKRYSPEEATRYLRTFLENDYYTDINVVDIDGIIAYSTVPEAIGEDLRGTPQSEEFLTLLEDTKTLVQDPRRDPLDPDKMMLYAGAAFPDRSGFVQIGMDMEIFEEMAVNELFVSVRNRRIGNDGFFLVCNSELHVVQASSDRYIGWDLSDQADDVNNMLMDESSYVLLIEEKPEIVYAQELYDYRILGVYPLWSALSGFRTTSIAVLVIETVLFPVVFLVIYIILRRRVVNEIESINTSLSAIADGNLSEVVDVRSSAEFDALSDHINAVVEELRRTIGSETE
ncbi:MAG: HAMP domain-containing protein [Lachnospiraceae bacterium]|nr:HAMP domain-containing protein [Lachnospiraceae bacterium]